ncbi:CAP domain-containing protein [Gracilibacillus oryzae]|nr:CAP domain-containing protein [Gracilibacillus oryzae]
MHNKYLHIAVFCLCLFLVACNQSSLQDREGENIEPNYVSYDGEQVGTGQQLEEDSRFRIPVNPGREQNIFEDRPYDPNFKYRERNEFQQQTPQDNLRQGNEQQVPQDGQQGNNRTETAPNTPNQDGNNGGQLDQIRQQVIDLTNKARQENGAGALQLDAELASVAQTKSEDMAQNNYFSHTSPTYGSPFDMMQTFGVEYTKASENIAAGQQSAEQVVQSWLNSEGHRRNMLDPAVTHIGVGYEANGDYWTQMFIKK